jgi:hypothetical protein
MNILTQDTVSVSTWVLIKQLQTYSMFTLEGREMLSGKLKGMGGFSGKKNNTDLLHLLMEGVLVRIFCCCSF